MKIRLTFLTDAVDTHNEKFDLDGVELYVVKHGHITNGFSLDIDDIIAIPLPETLVKNEHSYSVEAKLRELKLTLQQEQDEIHDYSKFMKSLTESERKLYVTMKTIKELLKEDMLTCAVSGSYITTEKNNETGITIIKECVIRQIALVPKGTGCDSNNKVKIVDEGNDNLNKNLVDLSKTFFDMVKKSADTYGIDVNVKEPVNRLLTDKEQDELNKIGRLIFAAKVKNKDPDVSFDDVLSLDASGAMSGIEDGKNLVLNKGYDRPTILLLPKITYDYVQKSLAPMARYSMKENEELPMITSYSDVDIIPGFERLGYDYVSTLPNNTESRYYNADLVTEIINQFKSKNIIRSDHWGILFNPNHPEIKYNLSIEEMFVEMIAIMPKRICIVNFM